MTVEAWPVLVSLPSVSNVRLAALPLPHVHPVPMKTRAYPIAAYAFAARSRPRSSRPRQRLARILAITHLMLTMMIRAMRATEHLPIRLDAVPDDPALAVFAHRRERVDRAFE